jgi:hypothetical protein
VFCFSPFSGLDRPARFDVFAMPSRFHTSFTGKVSIVYHDSVTAHRIPAPPFPTTTTTGKKRIYLVNEECMSLPSSVFEWKTGGGRRWKASGRLLHTPTNDDWRQPNYYHSSSSSSLFFLNTPAPSIQDSLNFLRHFLQMTIP